MIVVHGTEAAGGEGTREDRQVLLSIEHMVSILNSPEDYTLIVSQSQTKEGSIMLGVEETPFEVAGLKRAWLSRDERVVSDAVAVGRVDGKYAFYDDAGKII